MNVDKVLDRLKEKGHRITPQRAEVVKLLFKLPHPTAEKIHSVMSDTFPNVSQATVYNTLHVLKELRLVHELTNASRIGQYEIARAGHGHFNCRECGGITDIETQDEALLQHIGEKLRTFQMESWRLEIFGMCPDCLQPPSTVSARI